MCTRCVPAKINLRTVGLTTSGPRRTHGRAVAAADWPPAADQRNLGGRHSNRCRACRQTKAPIREAPRLPNGCFRSPRGPRFKPTCRWTTERGYAVHRSKRSGPLLQHVPHIRVDRLRGDLAAVGAPAHPVRVRLSHRPTVRRATNGVATAVRRRPHRRCATRDLTRRAPRLVRSTTRFSACPRRVRGTPRPTSSAPSRCSRRKRHIAAVASGPAGSV